MIQEYGKMLRKTSFFAEKAIFTAEDDLQSKNSRKETHFKIQFCIKIHMSQIC